MGLNADPDQERDPSRTYLFETMAAVELFKVLCMQRKRQPHYQAAILALLNTSSHPRLIINVKSVGKDQVYFYNIY